MPAQIQSLQPNGTISLFIDAREEYSTQQLQVQKGEQYTFTCEPNQKWKDSFIKTSPNGFFNIAAWIAGLRVKKVKCFCLCACYNEQDNTAIPIGEKRSIEIAEDGILSFFPNDTRGYYDNNSGAINVVVQRQK